MSAKRPKKTDTQKQQDRVVDLFLTLTDHLRREIRDGKPSDVVIKEARQMLKDFGYLLNAQVKEEIQEGLSNQGKGNVHPFPVAEKEA